MSKSAPSNGLGSSSAPFGVYSLVYFVKNHTTMLICFTMAYVTYLIIYVLRKSLSVSKPFMLSDESLGVTKAQLGVMDSGFFFTYAVVQIIIGPTADYYGPKLVLMTSVVVSGLAAVCFSQQSEFGYLLFFWTVEGIGHAPCFSCLLNITVPHFPAYIESTMTSLFCSSQQLGSVASGAVGTFVAAKWGWRAGFGLPGVLILLWALLLLFQLPAPAKSASTITVAPRQSFLKTFIEASKIPGIKRLCLVYFHIKTVRYCFLSWLPTLIADMAGVGESVAGYCSIPNDIAGTIGGLGVGPFVDKTNRKYLTGKITLGLLFVTLIIYAIALVVWPSNLVLLVCASAFTGLLISIGDSIYGALAPIDVIKQHVERNPEGTGIENSALGLVNGVGSFGGFFQGIVTPTIIHYFGWVGVIVFLAFNACAAFLLSQSLGSFEFPPKAEPQRVWEI